MRVLVTGGSGFIGSHVVDKLRDKNVVVRVFDCNPPTFRDDVEFVRGSILDLDALSCAMEDVALVYHLAAVADVKDVFHDPRQAEDINVRGTVNVLEAARLSDTVRRVVYASTTWVYSGTELQDVDEATPLHAPDHFYSATKLTGEHYCQTYHKLYDVPFTILRYGIPYGPRSRDGAVIPIFAGKALRGEPLTIAGDGLQYRKFVYVEDLAEGTAMTLSDVAENQIYNLDGTEKITIKRIAETVAKQVGNVSVEYIPARPGDFTGKNVFSVKAFEQLGWRPRVGFEEGLSKYLAWYRARAEQELVANP